jgi:hypothetical protein
MTKPALKYPCDCCQKPNLVVRAGYACAICEFEMDLAEAQFNERQAKLPKRKCRDCGDQLPADRYYRCSSCTNYRDLELNRDCDVQVYQ